MTKMKNRGFTLVEVMVAAAIAGGLALVIGTLTKQSNQASVKMQSDIDATAIANEIMGHLSDPLVCQHASNLGGKSISGLPGSISTIVSQIRKKDANNIYPTGTALAGPFYGSSNLAIKSYTLDDPTAGTTDGVDSSGSPRDVYFTIHFFRKQINQNAANNAEIIRKIKVVFQTDANNTGTNIAFCKAVSTGYDGVWQRGTLGYINDINYMGGNVGIGTATPDSVLETVATGTKGTAYTGVLLNNTATSNTSSIRKIGLDVQSTGAWSGTSAVNVGLNVNATGGTTNYSALFNGGNVGIGTTVPGVTLDVSGQGRFQTTAAQVFQVIGLGAGYADATNGVATIYSQNSTGSGGNVLKVGSAYASNGLVVKDNGNVGVGLTNQDAAFQVSGPNNGMSNRVGVSLGTSGGYVSAELKSPSGGFIDFGVVSNDFYGRILYSNASNSMEFHTASTERVRINSAGNVGIGTNNPLEKLHVFGRAYIEHAATATEGLYNLAGFENHVPTKLWVRNQVAAVLGDTGNSALVGSIASSIANFATTNTMTVIKQSVCERSRIYVTSGGGPFPGTWDGTYCNYSTIPIPPNCTINGNCVNIYASNYVYSGGTMYAQNGFCPGGGGCLTRADRLRCPDGYFMYGIAYGFPQCKYTGVGTPTANWHTTGPYAY